MLRIMVFAISMCLAAPASAAPPKLTIFNFDVNVGDATLIVSPDGQGVLIDAGNNGRGRNPIVEFLNRAKASGFLQSLQHVVVTHYDADHLGGMDEVLENGWYPVGFVHDRGNAPMKGFSQTKANSCSGLDAQAAANVVPWGTTPAQHCSKPAACVLMKYLVAADVGGRRRTMRAGDVISLDHGLEIVALVAGGTDIDGQSANLFFPGRRGDCAENDMSIGLLVKYGDFRFLIAGDLTGEPGQNVADVEDLIKDDAQDVDVYHVNHHGSKTSSSLDFMQAIKPTVAIVSNGKKFCHPTRAVMEDRILNLDPVPDVFLTNEPSDCSWSPPIGSVADANNTGYDGIVEIAVWRRTYRVYRWRNGSRLGNRRYRIKQR